MVNMAYASIFGLSLSEGLKYGLHQLRWDEEDKNYLEALTLWVAWHQQSLRSDTPPPPVTPPNTNL
jgi:hypothetical protein